MLHFTRKPCPRLVTLHCCTSATSVLRRAARNSIRTSAHTPSAARYLMADAPLYTSTRERRRQTDLADFYALLKASEAVEKAYARGAVSAADYETACSQLMAQFRAGEAALTGDGTIARSAMQPTIPSRPDRKSEMRYAAHGVHRPVLTPNEHA